ncbi:hypothetical protein [Fundidesulfovibrio putealis]|uniref:hypothetical protein n=1 Tax=Fundidesulfovibrio putealis TaxID=270496 RepID=UPI0005BA3C81|nr:hypothetical protein [Fundidesulfovibrio putealis]
MEMFLYRLASWLIGMAFATTVLALLVRLAARVLFAFRPSFMRSLGALLSANLSGVLMNAGVVLSVSLGLGEFAIWAMGLVMLAGGFLLASYVLGRGCDVESGEILGFRRAMAVLAVGTVLPFLLLALVSVAGTFLTGGVSP